MNGVMHASMDFFRASWQQFRTGTSLPIRTESLESKSNKIGSVAIVGAGPGDVELLTIKAYKALQCADIILFDWLVDESVLRVIPKHIEKEFVGKRAGKHSMQQADICKRIVFHALAGKKVVRLKGGDPAIFARTVEESQALTLHNIPFCIIPGITSASGASAYSGIPLTHRECAQSVQFITASLQNPLLEPEWPDLVKNTKNQTLVFYMGLRKLDLICSRLMEHKLHQDFPVAVIDSACTPYQRIVTSSVSKITAKVEHANFSGPAMIIVGKVVNFTQSISPTMLADISSKHLPTELLP